MKTKTFSVAKLKHLRKRQAAEHARQRHTPANTQTLDTLGSLFAEVQRRMGETDVARHTRVGRKNILERLRTHWQRGSFDAFLARNVTPDVVVELRQYLSTHAPWRYNFGKIKHGYLRDTVNQTLWALRIMLDVAVEHSVIPDNPFRTSSALRGSLFSGERGSRDARRVSKRWVIPSRPDMMRIIAAMRELPAESRANPEQRRHLIAVAEELADHTELLAFSGMRKQEARDGTLADDHGEELKIWGTKSGASNREIPINPALRAVLDRIRSRRVGDAAPLVITAEPGKALKRACRRLGLPPMRNHDLRHFFASACISSGIDMPTLARWLGHSDGGALAMRTYGHLLKDHSRAAAKRVNFSGADGTDSAARSIRA